MKLVWSSLNSFGNEESIKAKNKRGIYIWGFRIASEFIPYYIGIANDVEKRITEHLLCIISGKYTIYDKEDLGLFYQKTALYTPKWPSSFQEFLTRRKVLRPHIDFMIEHLEFSFAEVIDVSNQSIQLKDIEKHVIELIGKENLANSRSGKNLLNNISHEGDNEIIKLLKK